MAFCAAAASTDLPLRAVAELLWSTDPGLNTYVYRDIELLHTILRAEWTAHRGLLCYKNALTVMNADTVEGLLVGHTSREWQVNFDAVLELQSRILNDDEANALNAANLWMDRLFPSLSERSYYVLELAVADSARGKGLAKLLLETGMRRARSKGCSQICIDVSADNPAVAIYERLGFVAEVETRVPYLEDVHGIGTHLHMVRGLEGWA